MPDLQRFSFPHRSMNPPFHQQQQQHQQHQNPEGPGHPDSPSGLLPEAAVLGAPDPSSFFLGEQPGPQTALDLTASSYLHFSPSLHWSQPPPPTAMALRNDLGSNISVLKTLNLRFRCFLAKVHELERRNKILELQLQQALDSSNKGGCVEDGNTREIGVQTGFIGPIAVRPGSLSFQNTNNSAQRPTTLFMPSLTTVLKLEPNKADDETTTDSNTNRNPTIMVSLSTPTTEPGSANTNNSNNAPHVSSIGTGTSPNPPPRFLPGTIWSEYRYILKFLSLGQTMLLVLMFWFSALRWEEEYTMRMDMEQRMNDLQEDLQESEVCQDELALKVQQLKAELVLFKGLMSNNLSELDSKIQEKAMKVDMDICRRIDITARLCDVAQQRNFEDPIKIFKVPSPQNANTSRARKQASQPANGSETDEPVSTSESDGGGAREDEVCTPSTLQINEEMQRMLTQLRECEFEDDCDSLAWEETEETLLLWEDFPGCTLTADTSQGEQEQECLEKVIKDTECLFKSREKEYQETIDQIELELATAKSDMNRHLHEYMEMCSMKRGLDVQMETCRRLITQSGNNKSTSSIPGGGTDANGETERDKTEEGGR
uniref:Intermediate filament family orphan 1b n=1 Tax=Cyprinus carpio TaxID=7962 RepID=A0A8C2KQ04_CYPCA